VGHPQKKKKKKKFPKLYFWKGAKSKAGRSFQNGKEGGSDPFGKETSVRRGQGKNGKERLGALGKILDVIVSQSKAPEMTTLVEVTSVEELANQDKRP